VSARVRTYPHSTRCERVLGVKLGTQCPCPRPLDTASMCRALDGQKVACDDVSCPADLETSVSMRSQHVGSLSVSVFTVDYQSSVQPDDG